MRDPRAGHASGKQAALVGPRTRLPYHQRLRVDFRVAGPGIVLGGIRDNGGPKQLSGDARADSIGCRIESHIAPRDLRPQQAQPDGSRLLVFQDAWWWKRRHG